MCQDKVWVKLSQGFWSGEEIENVKKFTIKGQTDGQITDKRQSEKLT